MASRPDGDVWNIVDNDKDSQHYGRNFKFDFSYISSEEIKDVVKDYVWQNYRIGNKSLSTLYNEVKAYFFQFIRFADARNITSLKRLTNTDVDHFISYLHTTISERTKKPFGTNTQRISLNTLKSIIRWCQLHRPNDVPTTEIFTGIIIQSQTGLRINEVLSIQEGCVKRTSDGYDYMEVTLGKTEKGEPIIHKVFINGLVKNAIAELTEHTAELRKESGLKELFLCRIKSQNNKIAPYTETHWNDKKLRYFIERHDIRDNKGDLYPLTSHQFRSTFVRELIKRKVPIAMIMKQYSHVSIEMTAHYLTLQEEEVKEIYSDMILSPESKIAGLRAKEIKGKLDDLFHGKTEDEIDDVISGLAKTMSFNPLPTGVCLYDFRRGNCTDGDGCFFYNCPNYITEVQFYPILKDELDLLEKEMARLKELGQEPAYQVQAVKYKYLKPLVESLEVQLNGKESVG